MEIAPILEQLANLSVSVVSVLALAAVIYLLIRLFLTIEKSMERIADAVDTSERNDQSFRDTMLQLVKNLQNRPFVCEAQKYYEEMKKELYYCHRKDELEKLRKRSQSGEEEGR